MSYSQVVSDLMHKLTKNEVQYQEGGKRKHKSKSKKYFNQLNSLRGGVGPDEDLDAVSDAIEQLVPKSWLRELSDQFNNKIKEIQNAKESSDTRITALEAQLTELTNGSTASTAELEQLRGKLAAEQAKFAAADTELKKVQAELQTLTDKVSALRDKTSSRLREQLNLGEFMQ